MTDKTDPKTIDDEDLDAVQGAGGTSSRISGSGAKCVILSSEGREASKGVILSSEGSEPSKGVILSSEGVEPSFKKR